MAFGCHGQDPDGSSVSGPAMFDRSSSRPKDGGHLQLVARETAARASQTDPEEVLNFRPETPLKLKKTMFSQRRTRRMIQRNPSRVFG